MTRGFRASILFSCLPIAGSLGCQGALLDGTPFEGANVGGVDFQQAAVAAVPQWRLKRVLDANGRRIAQSPGGRSIAIQGRGEQAIFVLDSAGDTRCTIARGAVYEAHGRNLEFVGDRDGDGFSDLLTSTQTSLGNDDHVRLFSGRTCQPLWQKTGDITSGYGAALAPIRCQGQDRYAFSSLSEGSHVLPNGDWENRGLVRTFDTGTDQSEGTVRGPELAGFGRSMTTLGDLNGDGCDEMAIASSSYEASGQASFFNRGRVYFYDSGELTGGPSSHSLRGFVDPTSIHHGHHSELFGHRMRFDVVNGRRFLSVTSNPPGMKWDGEWVHSYSRTMPMFIYEMNGSGNQVTAQLVAEFQRANNEWHSNNSPRIMDSGRATGVRVTDINGDGQPDLLRESDDSGVEVHLSLSQASTMLVEGPPSPGDTFYGPIETVFGRAMALLDNGLFVIGAPGRNETYVYEPDTSGTLRKFGSKCNLAGNQNFLVQGNPQVSAAITFSVGPNVPDDAFLCWGTEPGQTPLSAACAVDFEVDRCIPWPGNFTFVPPTTSSIPLFVAITGRGPDGNPGNTKTYEIQIGQ